MSEGQSVKKMKRTLADRLAGQEQVDKKFEKHNLNKKAKLEKKKKERLSKRSQSEGASTEEMQTESGGLLEAAGYERFDNKKSDQSFGVSTNTNTNDSALSIPVNTQELVALINNAQIEKLRGVIKICLKYALAILPIY